MNINKKLVGSLLGGGVASLLAFGGIKAGEKVHYDNQVKYFGGLRDDFNKVLPNIEGFKTWTIPKWNDLTFWKKHFETGDNKKFQHGKEKIELMNSAEELRDICYKYLLKEINEKPDNCNGNAGWCASCLFDREWYEDTKDY